jgi:adenylate cyclase
VVILIVAGAVVILLLATPFLAYTLLGPVFDRWRRARNDEYLYEFYCSKGWLHRFKRLNLRIPTDPRCKLCAAPFGGVGRVLGIRPSRKNSNFCRGCFETMPLGGHEKDVGVLFADLRGFTAWSGERSSDQVADSLKDFYLDASHALMAHDAIIDKFVGDEVMALFLPDMPSLGEQTCDEMLAASLELLAAAKARPGALGVGIGIHYGPAWVGNVGSADMKDFTALGDVVNVASRLQGCAEPGQLVISEEVFALLKGPVAATPASFILKGKTEPVTVHVIETPMSRAHNPN